MGWARGVDANGREIGYGVEAVCDEPGCEKEIDRGLAYRCGPLDNETDSSLPGCGRFFCGDHQGFGAEDVHGQGVDSSPGGGFCDRCVVEIATQDFGHRTEV